MDTLTTDDVIGRTTQAAEGLPRWRWTIAELVRLTELGMFDNRQRIELVGGEIVPMSPAGPLHLSLAELLTDAWTDRALPDVRVRNEQQFELAASTYTLPDILVWPRSISIAQLRGPDALLVVEIADTSLGKDLGIKRRLYAAHGVREYWVIAAATRATTLHRLPAQGDYTDVREVDAQSILTPQLLPALAIRLADLNG
jgi:Uma2 family endonuclease